MNTLNKIPFESFQNKFSEKFGEDASSLLFIMPFGLMLLLYGTFYMLFPEESFYANLSSVLHDARYFLAVIFLFRWAFLCGYTLKELIIMALAFVFCFVSSYNGHDANIFLSLCIIFSSRGVDFKKINRTVFVLSSAIICVTFILCALGVLQNYVVTRDDGTLRYSLGFTHPNIIGLWVMIGIFAFLQSANAKLKLWNYVLILAITVVMFRITNSRAAFLCIAMALILELVCGHLWYVNKGIKRVLTVVLCLGIAFFGIFSISSTLFYSDSAPKLILMLNDAFSGRLRLANEAYVTYGTTFLGSGDFAVDLTAVVDNLYARIFLTSGAPTLVLFMLIMIYACVDSCREDNYESAMLCMVWAAYGMMEIFPYVAVLNTTLLLAVTHGYRDNKY